MVAWPTRRFGMHPLEASQLQIELLDKHVDRSDRVVFCNVVLKTFWEQRALGSVLSFDKTLSLGDSHQNDALVYPTCITAQ